MTQHRRGVAASLLALVLPALAALAVPSAARGEPGADLSVSIRARSSDPVVTGDVWTLFAMPKHDTAVVSGRVTGAPADASLRLMARVFPFTEPATVVGSAPVAADGKYAFTVQPALATRYWLEVFGPASQISPIGGSVVVEVYVTLGVSLAPATPEACGRPVCHEHFELYVPVPASAASTEGVKHRYTYFGLTLSARKEPSPPKSLNLVHDIVLGKVKAVSSQEYKYSIAFSMRIGNEGYYFDWNLCTKDTESHDGVGLPGAHGCGDATIPTKATYLG